MEAHSAHRGQKPKRQPDTPTLGETLQGGFPSPTRGLSWSPGSYNTLSYFVWLSMNCRAGSISGEFYSFS
ncbi:hypothetical protein MJO29_001297, partial [Puccinia striiformis f. sp. tritici]